MRSGKTLVNGNIIWNPDKMIEMIQNGSKFMIVIIYIYI